MSIRIHLSRLSPEGEGSNGERSTSRIFLGKRDFVHITGISERTARGRGLGDNMPPMPRHSRPMPLHSAQESSEKSIKAVIRVS